MSSEDIEVRPYREGDEESVLELFNAVFAEGDPNYRDRSVDHWRWEFLRNPAGNQVVLGIEPPSSEHPRGRAIAQYACLPAVVNLRGERVMCGQGIDSVVHPDYRRGLKREGAFLKVAKYYFEHYGIPSVNAFGYGLPNQKAYRVGVRMLNYVPIAAPLPTIARNLFDKSDDSEIGHDAAPGRVVEVSRFDGSADALWNRIEAGFPMAIVRDARYLNWRYADCPSVRYRSFAIVNDDGSWRAAFVVRENWTGPPILALCELICAHDDFAALARILTESVAFARRSGQQRVETWIPDSHPFFTAALGRGFLTENSPFNLCIKIYRPEITPEWAKANWWYTIGDSDVF